MNETIGETAGKIWRILGQDGRISFLRLPRIKTNTTLTGRFKPLYFNRVWR